MGTRRVGFKTVTQNSFTAPRNPNNLDDGFRPGTVPGTGDIEVAFGTNAVSGGKTQFLSELKVGDKIIFESSVPGFYEEVEVASIQGDEDLTLTQPVTFGSELTGFEIVSSASYVSESFSVGDTWTNTLTGSTFTLTQLMSEGFALWSLTGADAQYMQVFENTFAGASGLNANVFYEYVDPSTGLTSPLPFSGTSIIINLVSTGNPNAAPAAGANTLVFPMAVLPGTQAIVRNATGQDVNFMTMTPAPGVLAPLEDSFSAPLPALPNGGAIKIVFDFNSKAIVTPVA